MGTRNQNTPETTPAGTPAGTPEAPTKQELLKSAFSALTEAQSLVSTKSETVKSTLARREAFATISRTTKKSQTCLPIMTGTKQFRSTLTKYSKQNIELFTIKSDKASFTVYCMPTEKLNSLQRIAKEYAEEKTEDKGYSWLAPKPDELEAYCTGLVSLGFGVSIAIGEATVWLSEELKPASIVKLSKVLGGFIT